jgi:hypothetical protein
MKPKDMTNDKILLKRKSIQGTVINNVTLKDWKFVIVEVFVVGRKISGVLTERTYFLNPFFAILPTVVSLLVITHSYFFPRL